MSALTEMARTKLRELRERIQLQQEFITHHAEELEAAREDLSRWQEEASAFEQFLALQGIEEPAQ